MATVIDLSKDENQRVFNEKKERKEMSMKVTQSVTQQPKKKSSGQTINFPKTRKKSTKALIKEIESFQPVEPTISKQEIHNIGQITSNAAYNILSTPMHLSKRDKFATRLRKNRSISERVDVLFVNQILEIYDYLGPSCRFLFNYGSEYMATLNEP
jgi:hypothetical protein